MILTAFFKKLCGMSEKRQRGHKPFTEDDVRSAYEKVSHPVVEMPSASRPGEWWICARHLTKREVVVLETCPDVAGVYHGHPLSSVWVRRTDSAASSVTGPEGNARGQESRGGEHMGVRG